jgi:hypothetical protein
MTIVVTRRPTNTRRAGSVSRPNSAATTLPSRLGDQDPPQPPRPICAGSKRSGGFVKEVAHPGGLDVLDGHAIDARGSAVATHLAPDTAHDVAGDLVKQSMEATVPILLGAAVQQALESTNPVDTTGAADGPSRTAGTDQSPSRRLRAPMKRGPFAPGGLCCPADRHSRIGDVSDQRVRWPPPALPNRSCSFAIGAGPSDRGNATCTKDPMRPWTNVLLRSGPREADLLRRNEPALPATEMHMFTVQPATTKARMP